MPELDEIMARRRLGTYVKFKHFHLRIWKCGFGNFRLQNVDRFIYVNMILRRTCREKQGIWCVCPANERRLYIVTSSLVGWLQTQSDHWKRHTGISILHCHWIWEMKWPTSVNTQRASGLYRCSSKSYTINFRYNVFQFNTILANYTCLIVLTRLLNW